jgi:hypothetical protein
MGEKRRVGKKRRYGSFYVTGEERQKIAGEFSLRRVVTLVRKWSRDGPYPCVNIAELR